MNTTLSTAIVNESNLNSLLPILEAYGIYMYRELGLIAGKEKFDKEMNDFPLKKYSWPLGCFLLAYYGDEVVGCVGLSKYDDNNCELKRMYTMPAYRQKGIAHKMVTDAIAIARQLGYKNILLDTNKEMAGAVSLYNKMGFEEIPAWCENENPNPVYFKYVL
ncbi:MAG: GNAT family N-acetyltransferase [Ferruginibacter sp.]